ncbi:hypothetical protein GCM10009678_74170 [Actinomadura kijaniata]
MSATRADHLATPFPDGLRWVDAPSGESAPALDAYLAGCIQTFITNHGTLDAERRQVLIDCAAELASLLGDLSGDEAVYVARMLRTADLISAQP